MAIVERWVEVMKGLGVSTRAPVFCTLEGKPLEASCGGSSEPFDFATDDLCGSLTGEQVAAAARDGYETLGVDGWDGEAVFVGEGDGRCRWRLNPGGDVVEVYGDSIVWDDVDITDFQEWLGVHSPVREVVDGSGFEHPMLDDGVVAVPFAYYWIGFGTPESNDVLVVGAPLTGGPDTATHYDSTVAVAAALMEDVNWPAKRS